MTNETRIEKKAEQYLFQFTRKTRSQEGGQSVILIQLTKHSMSAASGSTFLAVILKSNKSKA